MGSQTEKLRNPKAKISSLLECLRPVPEPDSDAWKRIRSGFLAEAREFSREAVTSTSQYRHNDGSTEKRGHFRTSCECGKIAADFVEEKPYVS